jgi:SAM-dependent methyltransferase
MVIPAKAQSCSNMNERVFSPELEIRPSPLARRLLDILPKKSGNLILEIGAREADLEGNHSGDDYIYLTKEGNNVTLVESGESIIDTVKEKAKGAGVLDVDSLVGNPEKLIFPDNHFDAVFSMAGLDGTYLPDSLKEIERVLKSGGKAMLLIYYRSGGQLMQGDSERLRTFITDGGLKIDDEHIRPVDVSKGLEVIIFELHK